ncbi:MAG: hypothetical protein JWQ94_1395, partial [Tardiphaga sp.]|nr:hypothetical protein [Tardiphaga sp.]
GLDCQYLPQAWSLGLELSFYLLVPWLLWSPLLTRGVVALSIICFAAALCQRIDPDTFAYRTLPGTLFMFAVGIAFARPALLGRWFPHLVCIAATALALAGRQAPWSATIGQDVLIGLALGVPLVGLVRNCRGAADEWLGNISYGLFLNHLLIMNVSEQVIGVPIDTPAALFGLIIVSSAAALLTYRLLERPILNWRHAVRDRPAPTPLVAAAGIAPD